MRSTSRGFTLGWQERRLVVRLANERGKNELVVKSSIQLPLREWQHVAVVYDPQAKSPLAIYAAGEAVATKTTSDTLAGSIATRRPWLLGLRDMEEPWRGMLDEVRLYARALPADEVALLAGGDPISEILAMTENNRSEQESQQLRRYYLEHGDAKYRDLRSQLVEVEREEQQLTRTIPTTMVMEEMHVPRETFVLERGLYNRPKEKVSASVPAQLLAPPAELPANRLGLAKWLVDRKHPLTARVAVNRYWSHFFGRGLLATPEDFGVRGVPPSDQVLLDNLAVEFMESGWDVKRLVRLIVTSDGYVGQASSPASVTSSIATAGEDAYPTIRLPAEAIRDSAFFAGGLLTERIGGPSVNPYQPVDLWKDLAYDTTSYSAQSFRQARGADLYRRSVYTFWKRTAPPPLMTLFDAPNRETCSVERPRTASPLQALALLNDVTFVEASRALAERDAESGSDGERAT